MRLLRDFQGLEVRLTDERLEHILEHPEMRGSEAAIEITLAYPERVTESLFDPDIRLYYRFYRGTVVGAKHLCVSGGGGYGQRQSEGLVRREG
jgi:hypothetical protein